MGRCEWSLKKLTMAACIIISMEESLSYKYMYNQLLKDGSLVLFEPTGSVTKCVFFTLHHWTHEFSSNFTSNYPCIVLSASPQVQTNSAWRKFDYTFDISLIWREITKVSTKLIIKTHTLFISFSRLIKN